MDIATAVSEAHRGSIAHGFWRGHDPWDTTVQLAKLALIVSEVGEAVEAVRKADQGNLAEELADICIRVFDLAGALHIDLATAIQQKMLHNTARPYMHGKLA